MRRAETTTLTGAILLALAACLPELRPDAARASSAGTEESTTAQRSNPAHHAVSAQQLADWPELTTHAQNDAHADAVDEVPASAMKARHPKRVVLVSIDGLRPDAITTQHKALHKLYLQGASPHLAHTINKSATLPSHASMVTGVDMDKHGIDFNAFKPDRGNVRFPTIFTAAHAAGVPATMYVGKSKLKHLLANPSDASLKVVGMHCKHLVDEALPTLRGTKPELVFLHFADPDSAGHRIGWMSEPYLDAVRQADACLDRVMDTIAESKARDNTLLIVTSDHGGHQRSHGTRLDVDQRIPWFAWGAGVKRGRFAHSVHTTDTAATVLAALGLSAPAGIKGQPVVEALMGAIGPGGMPLVGKPLSKRDAQ